MVGAGQREELEFVAFPNRKNDIHLLLETL